MNPLEVTAGATAADVARNTRTAVRSAFKYGIPVVLTRDDVSNGSARHMRAFVYQVYTMLHRYCSQ